MTGEKTIINTICGPYSIYSGQVYRGASANGARVGTKVLGAIEDIPSEGLIAQSNGEFSVKDNSIAAQIRNMAVQTQATNLYAVVEDQGKLLILPRTIQVERRKTKSLRLERMLELP